MELARIVFNDTAADLSAAGLVHGRLCLRVNDMSFPHPDWTDFVVVTLGWWCDAAVRLVRGERAPVEVHFMEGPFLVKLEALSDASWRAAFVEAGQRRVVRQITDIDPATLIDSIIQASEQALGLCRARSWWSNDADSLAASLSRLKSARRLTVH